MKRTPAVQTNTTPTHAAVDYKRMQQISTKLIQYYAKLRGEIVKCERDLNLAMLVNGKST